MRGVHAVSGDWSPIASNSTAPTQAIRPARGQCRARSVPRMRLKDNGRKPRSQPSLIAVVRATQPAGSRSGIRGRSLQIEHGDR